MEGQRPVRCSENGRVALHLWTKRQKMAEQPNGISENLDATLAVAYRNICDAKTPINSVKDLSRIKGVGKWVLRLMQEVFPKDQDVQQSEKAAEKGKKTRGPKRYVPQKNSVAYALLITLYRGIAKGGSFMRKHELIDEAEASGLSRTSVRQDKGKGKPGEFGNSPKDWYTGWSCMKTLIHKGLVVKSSCPAKYMLTEEGKVAACECLLRSGLISPPELLAPVDGSKISNHMQSTSRLELSCAASFNQDTRVFSVDTSRQKEFIEIPTDSHTKTQKNDLVDTSDSDSTEREDKQSVANTTSISSGSAYSDAVRNSFSLQSCTTSDYHLCVLQNAEGIGDRSNSLAMPPCSPGIRFEDTYDVILVLDDRENLGSRFCKMVDGIRSQFQIQVEARRLPVGDGIWVARHRHLSHEYVLDFIVERKRIDDLCSSIRDNRYRDQKLRLLRCGLQKLIYLVEGDPNSSEAAESIKTACFTTEVLEGFDVQRTSGITDTLKKYAYLTQSIDHYYRIQVPIRDKENIRLCPTFDEFLKKCQDLEKMTITDVFALQLMQIPQVTEDIALAVVQLYPTLLSLARAYSLLEGDVHSQEEMLKTKSNLISGGASRNIFKLVWGS
uniref:Crossover junction endonuclease MUS81 n=1 Tax=Anthurium amnicola TaxID=1678845 RepID=A0A1D1ZA70_9ARAE